jgi:hypothetical protein
MDRKWIELGGGLAERDEACGWMGGWVAPRVGGVNRIHVVSSGSGLE